MSTAVTASEKSLKVKMTPLLQQTFFEAGHATAGVLATQLKTASDTRLRIAAIDFMFSEEDPDAAAWAEEHAAELVTGVSDTTRDAIHDLVVNMFDGQSSEAELADNLETLLGDDARADLIARTETMDAANSGQAEAWAQAVDAGLLTGDEQREWIASDDAVLCDQCDELNGETTGLEELFSDGSDGPPAHPNCRCTEGLVLPKTAWQTTTGHHNGGKSERAKKSYNPSNRSKQLVAREQEIAVAKAVGGEHIGGLAPYDIHVGKNRAIEVKTIVNSKHDKITMHPKSLAKKEAFSRKTGREGHTVVADKRDTPTSYYHRPGVGSFRLKGMQKTSLAKLHGRVRK